MPIFSAGAAIIGAVGAFIGGLGAVGSFIFNAVASVGLSFAAQALAGKPKKPGTQPFSVQGKIRASGEIPRSYLKGWAATAGSLVYANTWGTSGGTPNAYLVQVIALSDLPCQSLDQVWVNGELCTLDDTPHADHGYPVLEYRKGSTDYLWVKFKDGTQTTADSYLTGKFSTHDTYPYESTRVGRGIAYAITTARVNEELFTGFPEFKFVLTGSKQYDPSKDDTAGGSGDQRWNDPATWGGDGDHFPIVQLYNVLRGISYDGEWLYGLQGVAAAQLPVAAWIAAIAKCRSTVTGPDGSEAQYRSGGEVAVNTRIADTVEALLTACQGRLAEIGGFYKPHAGAPGSSVGSLTDGDIISTAGQSFTPFLGLADTINGIAAKYPEPAEGWNVKPAPTRLDPDYEAQDGNRRLLADVDYSMVPYRGQVQRLMQSALDEARRARRHTFTLPPEFWVHEPGDVLTWTSERNGYEAKLFRIDGMADLANLDVLVDLTEVDPADYDWDQETDYVTPVDGRVGIARPVPQPIVDWFAEAFGVPDNSGFGKRPAIKLSWDGDVDDVEAVQFQVRLPGSPPEIIRDGSTLDVAKGSVVISENLLSDTTYEVRGRYIPRSDRATLWSNETYGGSPPDVIEGEWFEVTTPNIGITEAELDAGVRALLQRVEEMQGDLQLMKERVASVAGAAIDQQAIVDEYKARLWQGVGARFQENQAAVDVAQIAAADANAALAAFLVGVYAKTGAGEAQSLLRILALSDQQLQGALAGIEMSVAAGIGGEFAEAAIKLYTMITDELGLHTRFVLKSNLAYLDTGSLIIPMHSLRNTAEVKSCPIVSGDPNTITPDLRERHLVHETLLHSTARIEFPLGAWRGADWWQIVRQVGGGNGISVNTFSYIDGNNIEPPDLEDGVISIYQGVVVQLTPLPIASLSLKRAGVTTAESTGAFAIEPAVNGKNIWILEIDGPLEITEPGTYTIVPIGEDLRAHWDLRGPGGASGAIGMPTGIIGFEGVVQQPTASQNTVLSGPGIPTVTAGAGEPSASLTITGSTTVDVTAGGAKGVASGGDTNTDGVAGGPGQFFAGATQVVRSGVGAAAPTGGGAERTYVQLAINFMDTSTYQVTNGADGNEPGGGARGTATTNSTTSTRTATGGGGSGARAQWTSTAGEMLQGLEYTLLVGAPGEAGYGCMSKNINGVPQREVFGAKGARGKVVISAP